MKKSVSVLGTKYSIRRRNFDKDAFLKENSFVGYCNSVLKEIVVANASTLPSLDCATRSKAYRAWIEAEAI